MKIGFSIVPEKNFLLKLIKLQNEISNDFKLDSLMNTHNVLPHIPIIQGYFIDDIDYNYYFDLLFKYTVYISKKLKLNFNKIQYENIGLYRLILNYPYFIKSIHATFFENIKYNTLNRLNAPENELKNLNEHQKKYYLNFGSSFILDQYIPGITLFNNSNMKKSLFSDKLELRFKILFKSYTSIEKVILYKLDKKNSITNIIISKSIHQST